jgi:hypothetical protein
MTEAADALPAMPLFYKDPVVIDAGLHRDLTVAPSPKGYVFAAEAHTVMLAAVEFFEACREYPIIFSPDPDGNFVPLALLGLEEGENLFVDGQGSWKSTYIPGYVRRYPFIPADQGTAEFPIYVDQQYDGLNTEGGQRIYDEAGNPTDYCRHIQAFVADYQNQNALTKAFAAKLKELELLQPFDANVRLNDGRQFTLQGFFAVDENRLGRLGDDNVLDLFRKGHMGLIYVHMASIKNMGKLADLKASRSQSFSG